MSSSGLKNIEAGKGRHQMYLQYERLKGVLAQLRVCLNALEVTVDAEKAYKTLKEAEGLVRKEAWNIKYKR